MGYQPLITDVNNIHENQPQTKKAVSDINWKKHYSRFNRE